MPNNKEKPGLVVGGSRRGGIVLPVLSKERLGW